jgi:splicing factor 3B subunit 3
VIGSDSGKLSIVEFNVDTNEWVSVHCEVFGKTGCRRIVPGQYVAADPKGRALMIGKSPTHQLFTIQLITFSIIIQRALRSKSSCTS